MAVTRDIAATYRGPASVVRRLLGMGAREDRALAFLMSACAVMFIAQWPRIARDTYLASPDTWGDDLQMEIGGALLAMLCLAPLIFYTLAALVHAVARVIGGQGSPFASRLALFWALLAASPLALLNGLVAGFIGPGLQLQLVGLAWFVAFLWFWISGLREAHREVTS